MRFTYFALLLTSLVSISANAQEQQAVRSYDAYDSVGVNTHWTFGSPYAYLDNFSSLITALTNAKIRHFRDGQLWHGYDTPDWVSSMYAQTNAAGLKADLIVADGQTVNQLESGLQLYQGVEAIEPPNEWDINGGSGWASSMLADLPVIRQAGSDLHLTVLGPSLTQAGSYQQLGDISQYMDNNNLHAYFGGRNPETGGWGGPDSQGNGYGSINWNLDNAHVTGPNTPVWTTETGYQTTDTPIQNQIPELIEGTYAPRLVLKFFKEGVKRTYLYELIDGPSNMAPGYGLLRMDMTPKPAYVALQNLMNILQDSDTQFTPGTLNYTLSGDMNGVETLLLQKSNGDFYLATWLDGSIYDVDALKETPISPQALTLSLPGGYVVADAASFNPDGSVTSTTSGQSTYSLNVNSNVTIVHITAAQAASAMQAGSLQVKHPMLTLSANQAGS